MWRELVQPLLESFIVNLSYFTLFLKLLANRNREKKIKKLKSEKPKEGREATLLSELGFDPGNCLGKKIEEQKNKGA